MLYTGSNFKWPVLEVKPIADTTKYITGLRAQSQLSTIVVLMFGSSHPVDVTVCSR